MDETPNTKDQGRNTKHQTRSGEHEAARYCLQKDLGFWRLRFAGWETVFKHEQGATYVALPGDTVRFVREAAGDTGAGAGTAGTGVAAGGKPIPARHSGQPTHRLALYWQPKNSQKYLSFP